MGLVFEAEHARLRRRVAVKVLARHLVSDTQALAPSTAKPRDHQPA